MNEIFNFNGMFGRIEAGMCRLTMNGNIAVKTSNGYKSYNIKTGRLTNCSNFCFNIGEEFFFLIPTNKVEIGDIIIINHKPKCVIDADKNKITVINYEDSTIDTIIPERHVFMGNTYFYGKIVSMFGNFSGKKNGANNIMKYMMMSEMMKSMNGGSNSNMSNMLPFMLMGGNMGNMFGDMFNIFDSNSDDSDESDDSDGTEDDMNYEEDEIKSKSYKSTGKNSLKATFKSTSKEK